MSLTYNFFICLLLVLPATYFMPSIAAQSSVGLCAAIVLLWIGLTCRASDLVTFKRIVRNVTPAAALPIVWLLLQLLPLPVATASIWVAANEALGRSAWGHITLDLGQSALALIFYITLICLAAVSVFLSLDRIRALKLLIALNATIAISIAVLLGIYLVQSSAMGGFIHSDTLVSLGSSAGLGLIISVATATVHADRDVVSVATQRGIAAAVFVLSISGLVIAGRVSVFLASALGCGVYFSIYLSRRSRAPSFTVVLSLMVLLILFLLAVDFWVESHGGSPLLRFASSGNIAIAQRALSEAPLVGTGAGTYGMVMSIYEDLGAMDMKPPTTAVALAVELGFPAFAVALVLALSAFWILARGALLRQRDSVYAALSAACVASLMVQTLFDASLLIPLTSALTAVILGLGLAQHIRRGNAGSR